MLSINVSGTEIRTIKKEKEVKIIRPSFFIFNRIKVGEEIIIRNFKKQNIRVKVVSKEIFENTHELANSFEIKVIYPKLLPCEIEYELNRNLSEKIKNMKLYLIKLQSI